MTKIFDVPVGLPDSGDLIHPTSVEENRRQAIHHRRIFEHILAELGGLSRRVIISENCEPTHRRLPSGVLVKGQSGFLVDSSCVQLHPVRYGESQSPTNLVIGAAANQSGDELFLLGEPCLPISFPEQWQFLLGAARVLSNHNEAEQGTSSKKPIGPNYSEVPSSLDRTTELLGKIDSLID